MGQRLPLPNYNLIMSFAFLCKYFLLDSFQFAAGAVTALSSVAKLRGADCFTTGTV